MPFPARLSEVMGGPEIIGEELRGEGALVGLIRRGIRVQVSDHLVRQGRVTAQELYKLVIPRRTLAHRRRIGRFTREESDRVMRIARILAEADEVFGSPEKAGRWLRRETKALGGEKPLDLLDTEEGARRVETLLGRIEHGIAA